MNKKTKFMKETISITTELVFPQDTNVHGTLFGGKLISYIDVVGSFSAVRLCRLPVVTASIDSVDFIKPIREGDVITLESMVTWTGQTSMEVIVKVTTENLVSGQKDLAALSFLTYVAIDDKGRPVPVPKVVPQSDLEKWLNETGNERSGYRKTRRVQSKELIDFFTKNDQIQ